MSSIPSKRKYKNTADMAMYALQMSSDNQAQHSRLKQNLALAMAQDITPRQREFLSLYYSQGKNMREIAEALGVDKSTVSRTIKRGQTRLARCLRYGAAPLLRSLEEED